MAKSFASGTRATRLRVIGGRYGLSSKDFAPAMAKAALDELSKVGAKGELAGRNGFTLGINDDVSHTSLSIDPTFSIEDAKTTRAVFYGLGADGTVGVPGRPRRERSPGGRARVRVGPGRGPGARGSRARIERRGH